MQNVRQLIQQDNVFALFSVVGTNGNLAIRDFVNAAGVPQVFSAAGATTFGRDYAKYPWTIGYLPPYAEEGALYAKQILATNAKTAKIAVLYQSDDYGKDLLSGFRRGLGSKARSLIVQTVGYDPTTSDVQSQVAQLKASGANTFMIFAFGKFAIQSFVYANKLGWKPQIYVNDVASASSIMALDPAKTAEGSISILWGKDPATPKFKGDAGVALAGEDHQALRAGRQPVGRVPRRGHGGGVLVRRRAQGRGQEPHAQEPDDRGDAHERGEQPVPDPRREGAHDAHLPVPDLGGAVAALAPGPLGAVRRRRLHQAVRRS